MRQYWTARDYAHYLIDYNLEHLTFNRELFTPRQGRRVRKRIKQIKG